MDKMEQAILIAKTKRELLAHISMCLSRMVEWAV